MANNPDPVSWTSAHQSVLEELIGCLVSAPVMEYPDPRSPYVLHTDASENGLGAVLYQEQDDVLRVIAYGSRTLTPAEKNYHLHSGKLEFLALKWAICEQFRDYLYYSPSFVVYTDNNPLTWVLSTAKLNATGFRWIGELADFTKKKIVSVLSFCQKVGGRFFFKFILNFNALVLGPKLDFLA